MPANVVRTAADERHWKMAKEQAAKQGRAKDYAYIMGIFKRMSKADPDEGEARPMKIPGIPASEISKALPPAGHSARGAQIGEVHDWGAGKFRKVAPGKWEPVGGGAQAAAKPSALDRLEAAADKIEALREKRKTFHQEAAQRRQALEEKQRARREARAAQRQPKQAGQQGQEGPQEGSSDHHRSQAMVHMRAAMAHATAHQSAKEQEEAASHDDNVAAAKEAGQAARMSPQQRGVIDSHKASAAKHRELAKEGSDAHKQVHTAAADAHDKAARLHSKAGEKIPKEARDATIAAQEYAHGGAEKKIQELEAQGEKPQSLEDKIRALMEEHGADKVAAATSKAIKGTAAAMDKAFQAAAKKAASAENVQVAARDAIAAAGIKKGGKEPTKDQVQVAIRYTVEDPNAKAAAREALGGLEDQTADILTEQIGAAAPEETKKAGWGTKLKAAVKLMAKPFTFGFIDNFMMFMAGSAVDGAVQGAGFGAAVTAGIGNAISDAVGEASGGWVERRLEKWGASEAQLKEALGDKTYERMEKVLQPIGVFMGALVGMIPLAFGVRFGKSMAHETTLEKARAKVAAGQLGLFDRPAGGGEGSRGGKVVGHTAAGKPIYEKHESKAREHHAAASKATDHGVRTAHLRAAKAHQVAAAAHRTGHKRAEDIGQAAETYSRQAERARPTAPVKPALTRPATADRPPGTRVRAPRRKQVTQPISQPGSGQHLQFSMRQETDMEKSAVVAGLEQLFKAKGGPFKGPRGGLWADPQHKIPWKPGVGVTPQAKHRGSHKAHEVHHMREAMAAHNAGDERRKTAHLEAADAHRAAAKVKGRGFEADSRRKTAHEATERAGVDPKEHAAKAKEHAAKAKAHKQAVKNLGEAQGKARDLGFSEQTYASAKDAYKISAKDHADAAKWHKKASESGNPGASELAQAASRRTSTNPEHHQRWAGEHSGVSTDQAAELPEVPGAKATAKELSAYHADMSNHHKVEHIHAVAAGDAKAASRHHGALKQHNEALDLHDEKSTLGNAASKLAYRKTQEAHGGDVPNPGKGDGIKDLRSGKTGGKPDKPAAKPTAKELRRRNVLEEVKRAFHAPQLAQIMMRNPAALKETVDRTLWSLQLAFDSPKDVPKEHQNDVKLLIAVADAMDEDEKGFLAKLEDMGEAWRNRTQAQEDSGQVKGSIRERMEKIVGHKSKVSGPAGYGEDPVKMAQRIEMDPETAPYKRAQAGQIGKGLDAVFDDLEKAAGGKSMRPANGKDAQTDLIKQNGKPGEEDEENGPGSSEHHKDQAMAHLTAAQAHATAHRSARQLEDADGHEKNVQAAQQASAAAAPPKEKPMKKDPKMIRKGGMFINISAEDEILAGLGAEGLSVQGSAVNPYGRQQLQALGRGDPNPAIRAAHMEKGGIAGGTVYQGEHDVQASRGGDDRETFMRLRELAGVVEQDPAGFEGQGGLPDWWKDAGHLVNMPVGASPIVKAVEPPTQILDDSEPMTRAMTRTDPREGQMGALMAYQGAGKGRGTL